jgi:transcription elongation factor Elf1
MVMPAMSGGDVAGEAGKGAMSDDQKPIQFLVICRQASDYLKPGYARGPRCCVCGKELQVSPAGMKVLENGGYAFCNPCGFRMHERLESQGVDITKLVTPTALEQARQNIRQLAQMVAEQAERN